MLSRQVLVVLAYVEVFDVILAAVLLDLVDLIIDRLLINLVRNLAVKDHFIFFVAHLVEFLVTELALTLRSHEGDLGLPQQDARVVDLLDKVLLVRMVALLRGMFLLLVEQVLCRGAGSQVLVGVSFDLSQVSVLLVLRVLMDYVASTSLCLFMTGIMTQNTALWNALLVFDVRADVGVDSLVGQVLLVDVYLRNDV